MLNRAQGQGQLEILSPRGAFLGCRQKINPPPYLSLGPSTLKLEFESTQWLEIVLLLKRA